MTTEHGHGPIISRMNRWMEYHRDSLWKGVKWAIAVVIPLVVVAWVWGVIGGFAEGYVLPLLPISSDGVFGKFMVKFLLPLAVIVTAGFCVWFVGLMIKTNSFRWALAFIDRLFDRFPAVRTLHQMTKQMIETGEKMGLGGGTNGTQGVVWVPFGSEYFWVPAIVTGENKERDELYVIVPTAPSPVNGYAGRVKKSDAIPSGWTVAEVTQFVLSGGTIVPPEQEGKTELPIPVFGTKAQLSTPVFPQAPPRFPTEVALPAVPTPDGATCPSPA